MQLYIVSVATDYINLENIAFINASERIVVPSSTDLSKYHKRAFSKDTNSIIVRNNTFRPRDMKAFLNNCAKKNHDYVDVGECGYRGQPGTFPVDFYLFHDQLRDAISTPAKTHEPEADLGKWQIF